MSLCEHEVKHLLDVNFLIKVYYLDNKKQNKFAFLAKSSLINCLDIPTEHKEATYYLNVDTDTQFDFSETSIIRLDYFCVPVGFSPSDFLEKNTKLSKDILLKSETYKQDIKKHILALRLNFQDYLERFCINSFKDFDDQQFRDKYLLKNYPKILTPSVEAFQEYKEKLIEEYYSDQITTSSIESNNNEQALIIDALTVLDIPQKNFLVNDFVYIEAVKRQWKKIIDKHRDEFIKEVSNIDKSQLEEDEKEEFFIEIDLLEKELQKNIEVELSNKNTIEDIISYWPLMIQPIPTFVYVKN